MTDLEIARGAKLLPISTIASKLNIPSDAVYPFGNVMAKVDPDKVLGEEGKLILVTAINPTPAGEGKTTVSIGLADGMRLLGKNAVLARGNPPSALYSA